MPDRWNKSFICIPVLTYHNGSCGYHMKVMLQCIKGSRDTGNFHRCSIITDSPLYSPKIYLPLGICRETAKVSIIHQQVSYNDLRKINGYRHRGVSDPDMHHGTCSTHMSCCMPGPLTSGFLWSRWRGKRSRHSWPMRNPQFCVSGKRPFARLSPWCHVVFIMATDLKICKFAVTQHHWCIDTISTGIQSSQWQKIPRDLLNDVKTPYFMPLLSYTSLQEYVLKRACFHLGLGIGTGRTKSAT